MRLKLNLEKETFGVPREVLGILNRGGFGVCCLCGVRRGSDSEQVCSRSELTESKGYGFLPTEAEAKGKNSIGLGKMLRFEEDVNTWSRRSESYLVLRPTVHAGTGWGGNGGGLFDAGEHPQRESRPRIAKVLVKNKRKKRPGREREAVGGFHYPFHC